MDKNKYEMKIAKLAGKAMHDYSMISDKDKILVAFSGGKDSYTLLHILSIRKKWIPIKYDLAAAYIKTNAPCSSEVNTSMMEKVCSNLGIKFYIKEMNLEKAKRSECFWCSWNRRKELFNLCDELKFNKLALGHHKDDIIETLLLNLFYHSEYSTMPPKLEFFKGKLTVIRPLAYLEEHMTRRYAEEHGFTPSECSIDFNVNSKRLLMKNVIKDLKKEIPKIKSNLFNSMKKDVKQEYLV